MPDMLIPKPLEPGDTVAIVAPCSPAAHNRIQPAADLIAGWGYVPQLYPSCYEEGGYLSGSDSRRAADLNQAFADPSVKGIVALRGGYGGARLAKYLDYAIIKANPKVFCGFSDVTVLHLILNQRCGLATFHTPMPSVEAMCRDPFTRRCFAAMLQGAYPDELQGAQKPLKALCEGEGEGILTGGNLTVLASTAGTPYALQTHGKVLFLEDVGERAYAIDRCLIQLRDSGMLEGCQGILLGTWQECEPAEQLDGLFREILAPLGIPVAAHLPCGHSVPSLSLPLGFRVKLSAWEGSISIRVKRS